MKIDSGINSALATTQTNATRATNKVDAADALGAVQQTSAASSTVNLSSTSALHAAKSSDIDTAKVDAIKAALRNGTYKIDSGKIADGILGDAKDLLQAKAS